VSHLTLRDVATDEEIIIPPEGFVFGRAGGDADIQIEDTSISRRQARISLRQGSWVLEMMVVPPGQRLPKPQPLDQGTTFYIGQSEFEVLAVEDDAGKTMSPPSRGKPAPAPAARSAAAVPATKVSTPQQKRTPPKQTTELKSADDEPGDEEEPEAPAGGGFDVKALFAGVPKGIAYYLVNVPKVLVNPLGTVRKTIDELPTPALGRTAIIGYALPALFISQALGSIAGGIALLISPAHTFSLFAFIPIGAAIGAVIGAVISGFVFHPVLGWIIEKLKGQSDAKSRSNYFLQMMTVSILVAVPSALGAIVASIPIPFINLIGPLLLTVSSMVTMYVVYQWFVFFQVVDWFRKVLLVLSVLVVLGGAWGFVMGLKNTVQSLMAGSSSSSSSGDAVADVEKAQREAEAAIKDAKDLSAPTKLDLPKKAERPEKKEPVKVAKNDPPPPADEPKESPKEAREPPKEVRPVAEEPAPATSVAMNASPGYGSFARRREAIEKRLEADPTILAADTDLQKLYAAYSEAVYDIDHRFAKDTGKNPEHARLNEHLKNAELFKKTGAQVDKLASKLGLH
jgi:FHA domain